MINRLCQSIEKNGMKSTLEKVINKTTNCVFLLFFRLFPIQNNYMVLESEGDYTDNIKAFYDYLLENDWNLKYKIIWIVHEPDKYQKQNNVVFISRYNKWFNIRAAYYVAVAKFFVFSHPYWLNRWRKEQVVIGTTHSVSQLKATPDKHIKCIDYILVCSENVKEIKMKNFEIPEENFLILGMPRIDLLYHHKECIKELVPDYYGEKIILSMETFKQTQSWEDSSSADCFALNVIHNLEDIKELDEFLENLGAKLLIKIHHLQDISFLKMIRLKNIIYLRDVDLLAKNIQVNELLENADILLTDYSSVFYEFLLFNRPIGFLLGDINEYSRGFISDNPLEEMPGEKINNLTELLEFLNNSIILAKDNYEKERNLIKNEVFQYFDDKNCERLMKWIEDYQGDS